MTYIMSKLILTLVYFTKHKLVVEAELLGKVVLVL